MVIKGVGFDLEGTLVHQLEELHFRAFIVVAARFNLNLTLESLVQKIPYTLGGGDRRISQGIARLLNRPELEEEILAQKRAIYSCKLESLDRIEIRPGAEKAIEAIKAEGLPIAIGSLTSIEHARIILAKSGIGRLFPSENQVFEKDVKNLKPAPDVFEETARRMGITPPEQLVFGDSATDAVAALAAGSKVIVVPLYPFPYNLHELIEAGATRIFLDWEEINIRSVIKNMNREMSLRT